MKHMITFLLCALVFALPAAAETDLREGNYLYKVSTVRAERGKLADFLEWISDVKASGYFEQSGSHPPLVLRHSQGDQWDLMMISPMGSWSEFHSKTNTRRRAQANGVHVKQLGYGFNLVAFAEDHFAYGPSLEAFMDEWDANSFAHVEMFEAAPGKTPALLEQRKRENQYLAATGQTTNMIFRRAAGSNVDVFTIGMHESLEAFAAPAPVTIAEKEIVAKAAGFKDLADISFYLRSLISGHHDTLANKVE